MDIEIGIDALTDCLVCMATGEMKDTEYRLVAKTITKAKAQYL